MRGGLTNDRAELNAETSDCPRAGNLSVRRSGEEIEMEGREIEVTTYDPMARRSPMRDGDGGRRIPNDPFAVQLMKIIGECFREMLRLRRRRRRWVGSVSQIGLSPSVNARSEWVNPHV